MRSFIPVLVLELTVVGCSSSESSPTDGGLDGALDGASSTSTDAASADAAAGPVPAVTGPITGGCTGKPFTAAPLDLASYGYSEEEYFFQGTATAYEWASRPRADGMWSVKSTTSAPYKTRMLVRRPTDPSKFNGTVMVEWLNVTGGVDADPDFGYAHVELLRSGFAWVGVSAQAVGVVGGGANILGTSGIPLIDEDPERYGTLKHPGDDYSYDIYTQAARALRHPGRVDPLKGLTAARLIGDGESQSAFRMVTYVNAIQPVARAFDGFFLHSRFGGGALLNGAADAGALGLLAGPSPARIRGDLKVPVFQFETQTDVVGVEPGQGFAIARQPDTKLLRTWEIAGTAHADQYLIDYEQSGYGDSDGGITLRACGGSDAGGDAGVSLNVVGSCGMINAGPQHWVEDTAVGALHAWVKDDEVPPSGTPLMLLDGGGGYALDSNGNALGGVRSPAVDVPIATYSGQPAGASSVICTLFGQTTPLSPAQLMTLYPTHDDYVSKVTAAAMKDEQAGFLLSADVPLIEAEAQSAPVPQ